MRRPIGDTDRMSSCRSASSGSSKPRRNGVSTEAGHTALTRTPAVGQLERHRLRQHDHAALGRAVGRVVRRGLDAGDRCHVDDRAGGLEQRRQRGLGEQEGAGEVDVDDAAPLVGGHVLDPVAGGDAGDVGEHVEPAVPCQRLGDRGRASIRVADVAHDAAVDRRDVARRRPLAPSSTSRSTTAAPIPLAAPDTSATFPRNRVIRGTYFCNVVLYSSNNR